MVSCLLRLRPNSRRTRFPYSGTQTRPRGLRILRPAASGKDQSLHRSSSPHKATALRGPRICGCAIFQIALWRSAQRCSASFSFVASGSSWTSSVPRKRSMLALAVSSSFMFSRALRYSESLPCGNRKFTGPKKATHNVNGLICRQTTTLCVKKPHFHADTQVDLGVIANLPCAW